MPLSQATIGGSFLDYPSGLTDYSTNNPANLSDYSGKIIIFSFVDIIRGWGWMNELSALQSSFDAATKAAVKIVAVVFNYKTDTETIGTTTYSGPVSTAWIDDKGGGSLDASIAVLMDAAWDNTPSPTNEAYAQSHLLDYAGSQTAGSEFWWGYLLDTTGKVADQYEISDSDNNAGQAASGSVNNLTNFDWSPVTKTNLRSFIAGRITNMRSSAPSITSVVPANGSFVKELSDIVITFSEKVYGAWDTSNYSLSCEGMTVSSFTVNPAGMLLASSYLAAAGKEIRSLSPPAGGFAEGAYQLVISGITDTEGNAVSATTIAFKLDKTAPKIDFTSPSTAAFNAISPYPDSVNHLVNGRPVSAFGSILVPFTEEINNGDVPANWEITDDAGSAIAGLSIATASAAKIMDGGKTWTEVTLTISGDLPAATGADETYLVKIRPKAASTIADLAGNPFDTASAPLVYACRAKQSVVLVLDVSGSMGDDDGGTPKIQHLKNAVLNTALLMKGILAWGDVVGAFTYSTDYHILSCFDTGGTMVFKPSMSDAVQAQLSAALTPIAASGSTAMGAGLAAAIQAIKAIVPAATKGKVILFTDGLQNRRPFAYFEDVGGVKNLVFTNPGSPPTVCYDFDGGVSNCAGLTGLTLPTDEKKYKYPDTGIPVDTIGIADGAGSLFQANLMAISTGTGGTHYEDPPMFPDIHSYLLAGLTTLKSDKAIQFATIKSDTLAAGSASVSVPALMNKSITSIYLYLTWLGGEDLKVSLADQGGVTLVPASSDARAGFRSALYAYPKLVPHKRFWHWLIAKLFPKWKKLIDKLPEWRYVGVGPQGQFSAKIERAKPNADKAIQYYLAVMVRDPELRLVAQTPAQAVGTGESAPISVQAAGKGLSGVFLRPSTLSVVKPFVSPAVVLAKYPIAKPQPQIVSKAAAAPKLDPALDPRLDAYSILRQNPAAVPLLNRKSVVSTPVSAAQGSGIAQCATDTAGSYYLEARISGGGSKTGNFQRVVVGSLAVHSIPDPAKTTVSIAQGANGNPVATLVLKDKLGQPCGPGLATAVDLSQLPGTIVKDLYDGIYEVELSKADLAQGLPQILDIGIGGIKIPLGPLIDIRKIAGLGPMPHP